MVLILDDNLRLRKPYDVRVNFQQKTDNINPPPPSFSSKVSFYLRGTAKYSFAATLHSLLLALFAAMARCNKISPLSCVPLVFKGALKNYVKKLFTGIILLALATSCERIPWELVYRHENKRATITSFKLAGEQAVIDDVFIKVTLPAGTDVTNLTPEITHNGLAYSPQGAQDFSNPVFYKLLDADSEEYNYAVYVDFTEKQYTVTFESNGGSLALPIIVQQGDAIGALSISTKDGYTFAGWWTPDGTQIDDTYIPSSNVTVQAHWEVGYIVATNSTEPDLSKKFSITVNGSPTAEEVTATFTAMHNYIVVKFTTSTDADDTDIHLGDYIDLPFLNVAGDEGNETNADNGYINATNTDCTNGKLLRLIVVGINSFNPGGTPINDNDTPHIVFHFQNVPGKHSMNATNSNLTGYLNSAMRTYISGKFLLGLKNAGVPDSVLWAPSRRVASNGYSTSSDIVEDKLWLPTEMELWGSYYSVSGAETNGNQASLRDFYTDDNTRKKYGADTAYSLASPRSSDTAKFCVINWQGYNSSLSASSASGVTPAFCVR
ncbi:MAG: hypothetical protein Ta2B_21170 [Termitinemataceae bacterium]|nr:MAG: hypothetical protein Ta2B_21170 [Termitinemataceae bacterium]